MIHWLIANLIRLNFQIHGTFPLPDGSFIRVGLMPFIMHTASITNLTGPGGLFIPLSSDMSALVRVSRA